MKSFWKVCKITLITLLCMEVILHIYNPFTPDKKGGHIIIPANTRYEMKDVNIPGLDREFLHTKNSMGFRGPELPTDPKVKKVICMGGSATECFYLNDGKDWPALLGNHLNQSSGLNVFPPLSATKKPLTQDSFWINNAGLSGKTMEDQLMLLTKNIVQLKPDYILLMTGLDDIGHKEKKGILPEKSKLHAAWDFLELPKVIKALFNGKTAAEKNNTFEALNLQQPEQLVMSDTQILQRIAMEQPLLENYRKHLKEFVEVCKANKIQLLLVSQVILYGDEKDAISDVQLANLKIGNINGRTEALLLKQYNKAGFEIAADQQLPFINLSARMPKDSRFFYDGFHFTNDGAEMAATMIYDESREFIQK